MKNCAACWRVRRWRRYLATPRRGARRAAWSRRPQPDLRRDALPRAQIELRVPWHPELAPALIMEEIAVHEHHAVDVSQGPVASGALLRRRVASVAVQDGRGGSDSPQPDLSDLMLVGLDGGDDDAGFYGDQVDAHDGNAHPGIDHDALVQDTVQDIEDARRSRCSLNRQTLTPSRLAQRIVQAMAA